MKPNLQWKLVSKERKLNSRGQWKLVPKKTKLNDKDRFWVAIEATHVSFKNGVSTDHLLLNKDLRIDKCKSNSNRRFIEKLGNNYTMPEFKHHTNGQGYHYGKIHWEWWCRKCHSQVSYFLLDSKEICSDCNHGGYGRFTKRMVPC